MAKKSISMPEKSKDAEIVVKRNFGYGSLFRRTDFGLYEGISVFANRRGYRFLSDYFKWMAQRTVSESEGDPGDHTHLNPSSTRCDELAFTFDSLTASNRKAVLTNANATKKARRTGSPIKQFKQIFVEIIDSFGSYLNNDDELRKSVMDEIDELIVVLKEKRKQLEEVCVPIARTRS